MSTALDQAMLYLIDLRLQVRSNPCGLAIVDRCLVLLTAAYTADAAEMARLEAEVGVLRAELCAMLGEPRPLRVN